MANEDQVYAFEQNFLEALTSIVVVGGVQSVEFGDDVIHETPRIEISFTYGGANEIDRGITSNGKQYLRTHTGEIVLKVSGTVKTEHLSLVGKVRNFMAWNMPTLINPVLPYYQVQSVFEQGSDNGAGDNEGDFEIMTELTFSIRFLIPPSAFDSNEVFFNTDSLNFGDDQLYYGE